MLACSCAPPALLVVIVPRVMLVPLRTRAATYVVEGFAPLNPISTVSREYFELMETTAIPKVAKRYPVGTLATAAGVRLKTHLGAEYKGDVVLETARLAVTVKLEGTLLSTAAGRSKLRSSTVRMRTNFPVPSELPALMRPPPFALVVYSPIVLALPLTERTRE